MSFHCTICRSGEVLATQHAAEPFATPLDVAAALANVTGAIDSFGDSRGSRTYSVSPTRRRVASHHGSVAPPGSSVPAVPFPRLSGPQPQPWVPSSSLGGHRPLAESPAMLSVPNPASLTQKCDKPSSPLKQRRQTASTHAS